MSRIRLLATTTTVVATLGLAVTGVASAGPAKVTGGTKPMKVTGGTTTVTLTPAALTLLKTNNITPAALEPATLSGATVTFPISHGHLNTTTLRGVIYHRGGLKLTAGAKSVVLRQPTIVSTRDGVSLYALARGQSHRRCITYGRAVHRHRVCWTVVKFNSARIARITDLKVNGPSATGTVKITAFTASAINDLAGNSVAKADDVLGSATVTPTFG